MVYVNLIFHPIGNDFFPAYIIVVLLWHECNTFFFFTFPSFSFISSRSVSNWFTEEGELVSMKFFKEIKNIYLNVSQSKKDE